MKKDESRALVLAWMAGLILAMIVLPASETAAFKPKKEYKMTVNVGPNFYWGMGAAKFAELVRKKTGAIHRRSCAKTHQQPHQRPVTP